MSMVLVPSGVVRDSTFGLPFVASTVLRLILGSSIWRKGSKTFLQIVVSLIS